VHIAARRARFTFTFGSIAVLCLPACLPAAAAAAANELLLLPRPQSASLLARLLVFCSASSVNARI